MTTYLIRRLFQMMAVVIISSMSIYFLLYLAPGGPLDEYKLSVTRQDRRTQDEIDRIAEYLGLHRGPAWGYVAWLTGEDWLSIVPEPLLPTDSSGARVSLQRPICRQLASTCSRGVIRGDFGISWQVARGAPVITVLSNRLRNTMILMVTATLLSMLVAIPVGVISAIKQYSRLDYVATTFTFFGTAMPVFWFGLLLIIAFGGNQSPIYRMFNLPYLPTGNVTLVRPALKGSLEAALAIGPGTWADIAVHAVLPTIVLSLLYMASWSRFTRSSMLEVLRQDYVRTARAKGLIERVVIAKHALRNALIPLVTILVLEIPAIFGGAIITETVFNWQGMGFLYINALRQSDYPVAMAFLFITALLVVFATLLGDILYTIVDPRIRFA